MARWMRPHWQEETELLSCDELGEDEEGSPRALLAFDRSDLSPTAVSTCTQLRAVSSAIALVATGVAVLLLTQTLQPHRAVTDDMQELDDQDYSKCADVQKDCWFPRCCKAAGQTCFEKNNYWATCMDSCTPGVHKDDPKEEPWSCKKLGKRTPYHVGCTWPGEDCSKQHECCHPGFKCVKKNEYWLACVKEIPEDWNGTVLGGSRNEYEVTPSESVLAGTSLYCFMAVLPGSAEEALVNLARERQTGIFGCEDHAIYASTPSQWKTWGTGMKTLVNTDAFIKIWKQVHEDGRYMAHDWVIKADADCVWFPDRVRKHLLSVKPPGYMPIFIKNTEEKMTNGGFLGAVEILSKWAVETYIDNAAACEKHIGVVSGEDGFLRDCMVSLGVGFLRDEAMMHPTVNPPDCQIDEFAAFHPMKAQGDWLGCFDVAMGRVKNPKPLLAGQIALLPHSVRKNYE